MHEQENADNQHFCFFNSVSKLSIDSVNHVSHIQLHLWVS